MLLVRQSSSRRLRRFPRLRHHPLLVVLALFSWFAGPAPAEAEPTPESVAETGVKGVISEGPIFGGPAKRGLPDSRPLGGAEFQVKKENVLMTSITTDVQGRFRISLTPGHYVVTSKGREAKGGNCSFEVDVAAGQMKVVEWICDTGLR